MREKLKLESLKFTNFLIEPFLSSQVASLVVNQHAQFIENMIKQFKLQQFDKTLTEFLWN